MGKIDKNGLFQALSSLSSLTGAKDIEKQLKDLSSALEDKNASVSEDIRQIANTIQDNGFGSQIKSYIDNLTTYTATIEDGAHRLLTLRKDVERVTRMVPSQIGRAVAQIADSNSLGRLVQGYDQYINSLEKTVADKVRNAIKNIRPLHSEIVPGQGITSYNEAIANVIKDTSKFTPQRAGIVPYTKGGKKQYDFINPNQTKPVTAAKIPDNIEKILQKENQRARTRRTTYAESELPEDLEFSSAFKRVISKMAEKGILVSDYIYDAKNNQITLMIGKQGESERKPLKIGIDTNNVFKTSTGSAAENRIIVTENWKNGLMKGSKYIEAQTQQLLDIEDSLRYLKTDKSIGSIARRLQEKGEQSVKRAPRHPFLTKEEYYREKEKLEDFEVGTPQQNAIKGNVADYSRYIETMKARYVKNGYKNITSNQIYQALAMLLQNPELYDPIIRNDPNLIALTEDSFLYNSLKKFAASSRNQNIGHTFATVSEKSAETGTIGLNSAQNPTISIKRLQNLGGLATEGYIRKPYGFSNPKGKKLGLEYGTKGGFGSSVGLLKLSPDALFDYMQKYNATNPRFPIPYLTTALDDGNFLISGSLRSDINTAVEPFKKSFASDIFGDAKTKRGAARLLKNKTQIANLLRNKNLISEADVESIINSDDIIDLGSLLSQNFITDANKDGIVQAIGEQIAKSTLGKEGRNLHETSAVTWNGKELVVEGKASHHWDYGERLVDTVGNLKGASQVVPSAFIDYVAKNLGLEGQNIQAITAMPEKYDMRSAFGEVLALIQQIHSVYQQIGGGDLLGASQSFLSGLEGHGLGFLAPAFNGVDEKGLVSFSEGGLQKALTAAPENLKKAILALDKWNAELLGMESTFDESGKIIKDFMVVQAGLTGRAVEKYGEVNGKKGATSAAPLLPSLEREIGLFVGGGVLSKEEGKDTLAYFKKRLGPSAENIARLEKARREQQEALDLTIESGKKDVGAPALGDERYISIGMGPEYDINLDEIEEEIWEGSEVINRPKTLVGRIEALQKSRHAQGKGNAIPWLNTGLFQGISQFGGRSKYLGGQALFLPASFGQDGFGNYYSRGDNDTAGVSKLASLLIQRGLGDSSVELADQIQSTALNLIGRISDDVYNKEGTEYNRNLKADTPGTGFLRALPLNENFGGEYKSIKGEDWKKLSVKEKGILHKALIAQTGGVVGTTDLSELLKSYTPEQLRNYAGYMYNDADKVNTWSDKKVRNYLKNTLTLGTKEYKKYINRDDFTSAEDILGLGVASARYPLMTGLDSLLLSVWGDKNIEGAGGIHVGPAVARRFNLDYDGDQFPIAAIELIGAIPKVMKQLQESLLDLFREIRKEREEGKIAGKSSKGVSDLKYSSIADDVSGIMSRVGKGMTGRYSLWNTRIRNYLSDTESGANYTPTSFLSGDVTDKKWENVTKNTLVNSLFGAIEQDAISSKKVIDRISGIIGDKGITGEIEKEQVVIEELGKVFDSLNNLVRQVADGKMGFGKFKESLIDMGLAEVDENGETIMKSTRGPSDLMLLKKLADEKGLGASVVKLFGSEEKLNSYIKRGVIPLDIIQAFTSGQGDWNFSNLLQAAKTSSYTPEQGRAEFNAPGKLGIPYNQELKDKLPIEAYAQLENQAKNTEQAIKSETAAEQAKILIAGKESAALEKSTEAYKKLGTEADKTGEILRTLSVTDYLKKLKKAYTVPQGEDYLSQKANEFIEEGRTFSSLEEMSAAYGYESPKAFLKDRGRGAFTADFGLYAHKISEILTNAGVKSEDLDALLTSPDNLTMSNITKLIGDKGLAGELENVSEGYRKKLEVLGFDVSKEMMQGLYAGIAQYLGTDNLMTPGTIALAETGLNTIIGNTRLRGRSDNILISPGEEGGPNVINLVDFKNRLSDKASLEEFTQLAIYAKSIKDYQKAWGEYRKNSPDGDIQGFMQELNKQKLLPIGALDNPKFADALKKIVTAGADSKILGTIQTLDRSTGRLIRRSVNFSDFMEKHPEEFEKMLNLEYKSLDDLPVSIYSGANPNIGLSAGGTGDSVWVRDLFSGGYETDEGYTEEDVKRLGEYLNLLKEQKNVEYEIYKLEQERKVLKKKQDDTGLLGNKSELKDLKKLRKSIQAEIAVFEGDDDFMARNKKRIDERKAIIADESKYKQDKWLAGYKVDSAEGAERELNSLLSKRLGLEKQIVSAQRSIDLSYSKQEKEAYRNIIAMTQQEVNLLDEKILKLTKSGLLRKEEADSIFRQYQIQQQSMLAQQGGKNHGSRSIWDMMKYDMTRSISRIFDYGISFRLLYSIPKIFNQINTLTQQLETSLMNLRVVTGYNREEANSLIISYQKLGKELGATTQEVANSANEWLRQGYSAEEAGDLIEASTKLSKLGMISSSEATQYLTSALKGYKLEAESAIDVVDKLTKVDMAAAVSAGDIAEGLSRTATSAQLAGLSIDETIGVLSTIGEVTQKSMQSVGESLKTLLSRYGNVKAGVFSEMGLDDDGETTENINDIEKVLSKLGISIRSSNLEMRDINVVLDELAEKWQTLDTVSKNAVATAFAGTRQRENFNVLMENYERAKELTEESAESAGTANEKYEAYADSLEAAQKRLTNAWEELTIEIGASPIIKEFTKGTAWLIENLDTLIQMAVTFGTAWASVKVPGWLSGLGKKITGDGQLSNFFLNNLGWGGEKLRGLLGVSSNSSIVKATKGNNIVAAINETSSEILSKLDTLIQVTQGKKIKEPLSTKNTGPQGEFRNGQYWYYNNGKPITRDAHGKIIRVGVYGKNSKVKLTKKQEEAYLEAEREALYQQRITQEEQQRLAKQLKRQRIGSSITSGIATGLMSGAMTKEVQGIGATAEQSVDATTTDKILTGAITGGMTAAFTGFLGPIGGIIGNLLGNQLSQLFTFWNHKSELERKQRVQEAEEQLEALSKIEDALESYSSLVSNKDMWNTEDYAQAKSYVSELAVVLRESVDLQERFVKAVRENVEGMEDTDLSGIFSKMILGTSEERSEIDRLAQIALLEQQREEQIAANEEIYSQSTERLNKNWLGQEYDVRIKSDDIANSSVGASKVLEELQKQGLIQSYEQDRAKILDYQDITFSGNSLSEKLDSAQKIYEYLALNGADSAALSSLQESINTLKELVSSYEDAEEAVRDYDTQIGYLKSGVTDLTNDELESLTYQGVIDKVAQAMEDNGITVRDYAGVIKDEYLSVIEATIKSDSKMSSIIKGEAKNYEELMKSQEKMATVLERLGGEYTYDDLKEIIEFASPENQELFTKLAEKLGLTEDNLRGLIYSADPTNIENLAYALHMTVEELEKLGDVVNNISFNDTLLSPEEVRNKYDDYFTFYEDLAEDGALSQENLEKIIASYPELLDKLSNMDELGSVLSSELFSGTSGKNVLYSNSLFTEYLSNTKFFDNFKEEYKTVIEGLDEDLRKTLENATSFEQIGAVLFGDLGKNSEELQKALEEYFTFVLQPEIDTSQIDKVIEYQTKLLDDQIDNLEEQKEALSEINDEREKELNLIRAQQALENARKEKKRVYREGVGWTYEADDEAISEAQDKLDELDTEKKQDELQLEIDKLTLQKEILESFSEQKELEALKTVYEEWLENVNLANEEQVNILSRIGEIYNSLVTIDFDDLFNKWRDSQEDKNDSSVGRISDLWDDLQEAQKKVDSTTAGTFEYNTAVDTYNTKLQQINEAIKESGMTEDEIYGKVTNGEGLKTALSKGELAEATLRLLMTGVDGDNKETTMYLTGIEAGAGDVHEQFKKNKYTYIKPFDPQTNSWGDFVSLDQYNNEHPNNVITYANLQDLPNYTIIGNSDWDDYYAYALDGKLYWLSAADAKKPGMKKKASGTLSLEDDSPLLINELGTEGIVTPSGTLTALPSKTGIVPADITKNLWELGEVAPNLIRTLDSLQPIETNNQNSTVNENGTYIDEINMSVYPTKDYDMDKFIADMKTYARITRHNN